MNTTDISTMTTPGITLDDTGMLSIEPAHPAQTSTGNGMPFAMPVQEEPFSIPYERERRVLADRYRMNRRMEDLRSVCLYSKDATYKDKVPGDLGYLLSDRALSDRDGQNLLLGDEIASTVAGGDVYGAIESYIGTMPQERRAEYKEKLRGCKTEADGKRMLGGMFRERANAEYEQHEQRMAHAREVRQEGRQLMEDMLMGRELFDIERLNENEHMAKWLASDDGKSRAKSVRRAAFAMRNVVESAEGNRLRGFTPSGALAAVNSATDWLTDEHGELDQVAANLFAEAVAKWAQELQAGGHERGFVDRFRDSMTQSIGNIIESSNYERGVEALYEASRRALETARKAGGKRTNPVDIVYSTGTSNEEKLEELEKKYREREQEYMQLRPGLERRRVVQGLINRAIDKGREPNDEFSWFDRVGAVVADSAPATMLYLSGGWSLAPLSAGAMLAGTASAYAGGYERAASEGFADFYTSKGRLPGAAEQDGIYARAAQDSAIDAAVEILPGTAVGIPATRIIGRLSKGGGKVGAVARFFARLGEKRWGAVAIDTAAGFGEEAVFEPLAAGVLKGASDVVLQEAGVPNFEARGWGIVTEELRETWSDSARLGGILATVVLLGGGHLPDTLRAAESLAEQSKMWELAGLSEQSIAKARASENPQLEASKAFAEELREEPEAMARRIRAAKAKLGGPEQEPEVLKRTGLKSVGDEAAALQATWKQLVKQGWMPLVEALPGAEGKEQFRLTERDEAGKEKRFTMDAAEADAYLAIKAQRLMEVSVGSVQADVFGFQDTMLRSLYGEAAAAAIRRNAERTGVTIREVGEVDGVTPAMVEEARQEGTMSQRWLRKAADTIGGVWSGISDAFAQRLALEGVERGGTSAFRMQSQREARMDGRSVFGSLVTYVNGGASAADLVEEALESHTDMTLQARAAEIAEANKELSAQDAMERALNELAAKVKPVIQGMAAMDYGANHAIKSMADERNWTAENLRRTVIEAISHIQKSRLLANGDILPASWHEGVAQAADALGFMADIKRWGELYKKLKDGGADVGGIEEYFAGQDAFARTVFEQARIDELVVASWEKARMFQEAKAGAVGTGAMPLTRAREEAQRSEDEIRERERRDEEIPKVDGEEEERQQADFKASCEQAAHKAVSVGVPNAPKKFEGVFAGDVCQYNDGGYYSGQIRVARLRDSKQVEQVKQGNKGKHGVINPLVGDYQKDAPPIFVWRRTNGDLEVISGRHRYALALATKTEYIPAYVYEEGDEHDLRWARLLDFENNMRDDQADELTAAIYVRETGFDDLTLMRKGLTRSGTKSRRGILIGREAREELWTRFRNRAVSPMDAEIIVNMTKNIADKGRIEEIQRRCCMLLDERKSWEYIGAMVQLMASKESVFLKQGLLDLGADFEADLARAAEYIATCTRQLNEAVAVMKSGRKMSGKLAGLARRLGQLTTSAEDSQQRLDALMTMKAMFENIGMYPDLVAAAQMWDGKTEVDAVGMALNRGMQEAQSNGETAKMSVEEQLAQAEAEANRRAAEEATGSLFGASFSVTIPRDRICRTRKEARAMVGRKGGPLHLENRFLELDAVFNSKSDGKFNHRDSIGRSIAMLTADGLSEDEAKTAHYTAYGNVAELFANGERMKFERAYKKQNERKGVLHVYSPFEIDGSLKPYLANIELMLYTDKNNKPVAYLLNVSIEKRKQTNERRDAIALPYAMSASFVEEIKTDFPDIVKNYPHTRGKIVSAEKEGQENVTFSAIEKEMSGIKNRAMLDGTFMKAPNGEPTNLTERQWLQVRTRAFKEWFGDWEHEPKNASKVVDENGEPQVVYHGTRKDFSVFKRGFLGEGDVSPGRTYVGHWFSDNKIQGVKKHMALFLNIREPKEFFTLDGFDSQVEGEYYGKAPSTLKKLGSRFARNMRENGFDGVIVEYDHELDGRSYVVLDSAQAKSATENRGTFDARNADITFSLTREDYRIAREFNALERSKAVTVDVPEAYADDIREAIAFARERYRELQRETVNDPIELPDGKLAKLLGRGFREVKQHAAGRRELAALCKLRELCQSAIFINSSENTQRGKETKKRIARFHYYLAKGNFVGAKKIKPSNKKSQSNTDEAYICLIFAEDNDGNVFYDANAENACEIDEIKSTSEELQAGRVTNTGVAGTEVPYKGRIHRIKEFVNYINAQIDNFSASVTSQAEVKRAVRERLNEMALRDASTNDVFLQLGDEGRKLRAAGKWSRKEALEALTRVEALVNRTRALLPPKLAKLGRLNKTLAWVKVYADMVRSGEVKIDESITSTPITQKFVEKMNKSRDEALLNGLSEEEARDVLKNIGAERLNLSLAKVTDYCAARLQVLLKERSLDSIMFMARRMLQDDTMLDLERMEDELRNALLTAGEAVDMWQADRLLRRMEKKRIDLLKRMVEEAYKNAFPKKQPGQRSPRGKMEADAYRMLMKMNAAMGMSAEQVNGAQTALSAQLNELNESVPDYEEKRTAMEEELLVLGTFGNWEGMSVEKAADAAKQFLEFVQTSRTAWQAKLEDEKEYYAYLREQMSANFTIEDDPNTRSAGKQAQNPKEKTKQSADSAITNLMNYGQLMRSAAPKLGQVFTMARRNEMADANANLANDNRAFENAFYCFVAAAAGSSKEAACVKWLNKFSEVTEETGVWVEEGKVGNLVMETEEARKWVAMSKEQRGKRREAVAKADAARMRKTLNIPTEEDIPALEAELANMDGKTRVLANGTVKAAPSKAGKVKIRRQGRRKKKQLRMSRDQALNLILILEQDDYRHLVSHWGFVPRDAAGNEVLNPEENLDEVDVRRSCESLYKFVGEDGLRLGYSMRGYVEENGKRLAKVFEEYNGCPLNMRKKYWKGNFNLAPLKEKDMLAAPGSIMGSGYGFMIDRVLHYSREELTNSATLIFGQTMQEQLNYIHTAHITRLWRRLLQDSEFANLMRANMGEDWMRGIKTWINVIDKANGAGELNMWRMTEAQQWLMRGIAVASIAGNMSTIVKQSSAILHAVLGGEVPTGARAAAEAGAQEFAWRGLGLWTWAKSMAHVLSGSAKVGRNVLTASKFYQARIDSKHKHVANRMGMKAGEKQHAYAGRWSEYMMGWMEKVDRWSNLVSCSALADAVYRKVESLNNEGKLGLSRQKIEAEALQAVGRMLNEVAQPKMATQKTLATAAKPYGVSLGGFLTMFRSETLNKVAMFATRAKEGEFCAGLGGYLAFGTMNALVNVLLAYIRTGGGDDGEEKETWRKIAAFVYTCFFADAYAIPLFGDALKYVESRISGSYFRDNGVFAALGVDRAVKSLGKLYDAATGETELSVQQYVKHSQNALRGVAVLMQAGKIFGLDRTWFGTVMEGVLDAATTSNVLRMGADVKERVAGEEG